MDKKAPKIIEKRLQDLTPYEKNPRKNAQAVEAVAASIREFGFKVPIVIDRDGVIVAGHTRYKAAGTLNMDKVPCIVADDLTEEQVKAFRLADNKTAEVSEWDFDLLPEELAEIQEIDMSAFGFDDVEEEIVDEMDEDNFDEEMTSEHGIQVGQVWACGNHRVMCGNSTRKEDADILMGGVKANMVFTDPPYGVSIGDKNKVLNEHKQKGKRGQRIERNIIGDTLKTDELYKMLVAAMTNLREHCADDCSYYVSSPQGGEIGLMMMMMKDAGLEVRHNLIWVKNTVTFSMGRLDYDYRHEPIFYTWTKKHTFYGGYSNTVIDDSTPVDKMTKAELKEALRILQQEKQDSVIYCDKPNKSKLHPTMKPVKLVARFIANSSKQGDAIADFFGGSGTTMIAAEQLGRRAFLMEKDEHYVDVIISRWEELTGEKAVLLG